MRKPENLGSWVLAVVVTNAVTATALTINRPQPLEALTDNAKRALVLDAPLCEECSGTGEAREGPCGGCGGEGTPG